MTSHQQVRNYISRAIIPVLRMDWSVDFVRVDVFRLICAVRNTYVTCFEGRATCFPPNRRSAQSSE